jgi:salicylate hydroxylase
VSARILVIGAGLGGLTAALALQREGFEVEVHEQASALGEVGAGLTLSRGAQHVFRALGLQDLLAPFATPSSGFPFLHYRTGAVLAGELNLGAGLPDDGIADVSRQCHRADLHAVLAGAFKQREPDGLKLAHRLIEIGETADGVRARFADGSAATGDMLIAADGVRSTARQLLWGDAKLRFTGKVAYRFLVDRETAVPFLRHGRGAVFVGPQRTFNRYTLRSGALINCVAIAATTAWTEDGWAIAADRDELLGSFADWHPDVTGLMSHAASLIKWGIFDRELLPRWSSGRVTLLGDAAHAMLPFLGLGAAMAIEDAMILARAFRAESAIDAAFLRYEVARRPRTSLIRAKSVEQGRLSQGCDPDRYDAGTAPAHDPAIFGYDPVSSAI